MNIEAQPAGGDDDGDARCPAYAVSLTLPAVPAMRSATVATCLQNLAFLCNRFDSARAPAPDDLDSMQRVLDRLMERGLPFELAPDGSRRFDVVELRNFINVADHRFDDPFWRQEAVPLGKKLMLGPFADEPAALSPERIYPPRRFRLRVIRSYGRPFIKPTATCRLRLPVPLDDATLTDLSVTLLAPDPHAIIRTSRTPGRLDVMVDPERSDLTVGAEFNFVSHPAAAAGMAGAHEPRERALALAPAEGMIRITPAVSALAQHLAADAADDMTVLRRYWDHLHAVLNLGWLRHSQVDPADPVRSILHIGWADCRLASALLVALCRCRQIPARIVGGYQLQPIRPGYHYWAEVWVSGRGWLPFDTLGFAVTRPADDSPWRDIYYGRLDYRARVECLPQLFTGLPGFRLPADWHLNLSRIEGGVRTRLEDSASGEAVYTEDVSCEALP